ncbi:hypothetical protein OPV22_017494 [Ensete ventricosum]|uniref:Uncharacterized protein n=1 Tax=Ensete ventricosum TaxID=4639 RepID=A0AAV8R253_ENSVE|nr:hypothetical protein OPV22_017494 [Ensete ventricosum]
MQRKARAKRQLCHRPHKWREEDEGEGEHADENLLSLDSEKNLLSLDREKRRGFDIMLKAAPNPSLPRRPPPAMEMRKVACAVLVAAASATGALAAEAPAPGPASSSFAVTPAVGAVIGASVLSFFAFYLQ